MQPEGDSDAGPKRRADRRRHAVDTSSDGASKLEERITPPKALDGAYQTISLADIDSSNTTFQCRVSMAVADVRRSLEHDGLEQPVDLLGPKPYRIIDGFRRCRAAQELGWSSIQAVVHEMADNQALRVAFTKNVVRKNLAPVDRANALWLAQRQGLKKNDLQELFGLSQKQVDRYLELLSFSSALQKCLDGKIVTMAHAKALHDFGVESPSEWKKRIESETLSAKQLKRVLRQEAGKRQPGRKKLYIKKSKDGLRVYPFSITKDAPQIEKDKVAKLLKEALEFLE
ncbi:MAG: ParB/RepB/Spo0J family partition protein [Nanoarchaeota archaeon]